MPQGFQKDVRGILRQVEDELQQLQQALAESKLQQDAIRTRVTELEALVRWQRIRRAGMSEAASCRGASRHSSREASPCPLERKILLKPEAGGAHVCLSGRLPRHGREGTTAVSCQQVL